jgi:hypothetical protein
MGRNNGDFVSATPDWQSPWPVGNENRTEYVNRADQTANARGPKKTEYRTEVDRTSQGTAAKDAPMLTKTAYQEKHGWVSPYPQGHPDHTPMVSKDEQTANVARDRRSGK